MKTVFWSTLVCCELLASSFVVAYSRVSKNGEARSNAQNVAFTVSPVYIVTPRTVNLRPGEAVDHPSTPKYSTLDEEMVAKLDGLTGRTRAQDRFHPPASFEHVLAHTNALKQQSANLNSVPIGSSSNSNVIYAKPMVSMTYDYPPTNSDAKPNLVSKPSSATDSFPVYSPSKLPDSFSTGPNSSPPSQSSDYDSKIPTFDFDSNPPKSIEFPGYYDHPFEDVPSYAQDPYHHENIIYDHIPDDHFHHHQHRPPPMTTEEPEMMDQRLNKRPYSYYFIGKKLWYIPLYFSIYFIIYIAALVLKSVARHKINFPANLAAAAGADNARSADDPGWMDYVTMVLEGVEKYGKVYLND